jgi:hypothetical protein
VPVSTLGVDYLGIKSFEFPIDSVNISPYWMSNWQKFSQILWAVSGVW